MEDYNCDDLSQSPHAIDCGHIFCRTCIRGFTPKVCPLCRQPFTKGRKLHVDAVESNKSVPSVIDAQFRMLLEHIALVSSEASTTEDVSAVVTEVNDWMAVHSDSDDPNSYKPLRLALDALCRYRSYLHSDSDLATSRAVENSLRVQLLEEREAASKLYNKLQTLRIENGRLLSGLKNAQRKERSLRVSLDMPNSPELFPSAQTSLISPHHLNDTALFSGRVHTDRGTFMTDYGEVDCIVDERKRGRGYQYLVHWVGEGRANDLWLPRAELEDCDALHKWLASKGRI
jgi:hypothetical protein